VPLPARRTRTVKRCSFDARSKGQPGYASLSEWVIVVREMEEDGPWRSLFARATRGLPRPSYGLMARLGVPVGGRVRKRRAVGGHQPPPVK